MEHESFCTCNGNKAATAKDKIVNVVADESQKVMVYYKRSENTSWTNAYIHYKVNGVWTNVPGKKMTKESKGYWSFNIDLQQTSSATVCFNNGKGSWDNRDGKNYTVKAGVAEVDQTTKNVSQLSTQAPIQTPELTPTSTVNPTEAPTTPTVSIDTQNYD